MPQVGEVKDNIKKTSLEMEITLIMSSQQDLLSLLLQTLQTVLLTHFSLQLRFWNHHKTSNSLLIPRYGTITPHCQETKEPFQELHMPK